MPNSAAQVEALEAAGWILSREAASKCRVNVTTIHRWIAAGKIKAIKVGQSWYVSRTSLVEHLGDEASQIFGLLDASEA